MEKAIDKGNYIDIFSALLPGISGVILFIVMNLDFIDLTKLTVDVDITTGVAVLIIYIIGSYLVGLLLMELAVLLQNYIPIIFDYYTGAIKKEIQKSCSCGNTEEEKANLQKQIEKEKSEFEKKEYWLIAHNYGDLVERKKAYSMMNRSLVTVPIAYILFQAFMIYFFKIGTWPTCSQWLLLFLVWILFYCRARRQARVLYHEVSMIYDSALEKFKMQNKD